MKGWCVGGRVGVGEGEMQVFLSILLLESSPVRGSGLFLPIWQGRICRVPKSKFQAQEAKEEEEKI